MEMQKTHEQHPHAHGAGCGHLAIRHEEHVDYLHEGHLHHVEGDRVDEHVIAVTDANAISCTPSHACAGHDQAHTHGPGCGHPGVPHGDHVDYLVTGHLHHPCEGHCDDHGKVEIC
jgi:hypothetical protein